MYGWYFGFLLWFDDDDDDDDYLAVAARGSAGGSGRYRGSRPGQLNITSSFCDVESKRARYLTKGIKQLIIK